jgi:dTDP-glucose 4,6-dehydratase
MRIISTSAACFIGLNPARRARTEPGWTAQEDIQTSLRKTVRWYLDNVAWTQNILDRSFRLRRLGRG